MERHTFTTNFWVSPSKVRKNGLTPINATITLNGQRASFSTGKFILPEEWDNARQRVKGTNETAQSINETLLQIRNKIYRKEAELMERGYVINANILRDACLDRVSSLQSKTLCQIFDEYLAGLNDAVGINISSDTFYHYSRTLVLIKEYMKHKMNRDDIALQELNYSFIEGFNIYLRKEYSQKKNTSVKYLRCLKRVVNIAIANRHLKFDPFLNYKVQREVVDKVFLTEEELRSIINKDFAIKRLERVRDIFIFCCFTFVALTNVCLIINKLQCNNRGIGNGLETTCLHHFA